MSFNMNRLLQQAQKAQQEMTRVREELAEKRVVASSGGGAVRVTANGHQEIIAVEISSAALQDGETEMLQDMVLAAVNDALRQSRQLAREEMAKVTGGMGFNLPTDLGDLSSLF